MSVVHTRQLCLVFITILIVATAESAGAQQPAASPLMLAGSWEISVQTRSPLVGPVLTHTICVNKALEALPETPKSKSRDDCQIVTDPSASNESAFTVRCAKKKSVTVSRFTYLGDHFDGTVIRTGDPGETRQVYAGRRVGDCEPEPPPAPPFPQPTSTSH